MKRYSKKAKTRNSNVLAYVTDPKKILYRQQDRIDYLEQKLHSLLVRDEATRKSDIQKELNYLQTVNVHDLPIYIQNTYNTKFFLNECDTEYKQELATAILDYASLLYPSYKNPLLEEIVQGDSKYSANYIYKLRV